MEAPCIRMFDKDGKLTQVIHGDRLKRILVRCTYLGYLRTKPGHLLSFREIDTMHRLMGF
jgi:hypothetical protein